MFISNLVMIKTHCRFNDEVSINTQNENNRNYWQLIIDTYLWWQRNISLVHDRYYVSEAIRYAYLNSKSVVLIPGAHGRWK